MIACKPLPLSTQSFLRQAQDPEQGRGAALSTSVCYGYDNANRLISLTHVKTPTTIESLTYTYDATGNRTQLTRANAAATLLPTAIASTNLAYDAANEQARFNSATTNLSYDNNGNLTSFTDGGGTTTYTWNVRNQLTAISGPSLSASFAYDGLGRRSSKTVNGTATGFWYDGADVLAELNGSTPTATFIRSLSIDEPFIRKLSGGDEFYQTDALGTSLVLTDGTGASGTTYTQEPFGKTTKSGTSTNSLQYTGREEDGTGMMYYRARYYSPQIQRFVSEDPIGFSSGDVNHYAYVLNNPVRYSDSLGLLFGMSAGEGYGESAAQYWADLSVQTGNPLYAIPGAFASLWTPCTSNQTFLGLIPSGVGARALPGLAKLLPSSFKGTIGEVASLANNWLKGSTLLGRQVRISGLKTVVDSAWRGFDGAIYYVESKFGTAGLTAAQRIARSVLGSAYHVERWTYEWVGNVGGTLGVGVGGGGLAMGAKCSCQ